MARAERPEGVGDVFGADVTHCLEAILLLTSWCWYAICGVFLFPLFFKEWKRKIQYLMNALHLFVGEFEDEKETGHHHHEGNEQYDTCLHLRQSVLKTYLSQKTKQTITKYPRKRK